MLPQTDLQQIYTRGKKDLSSLNKERILVTGATGFFGTWMCEALNYQRPKNAPKILAMARNLPTEKSERLEYLEQDVRHPLKKRRLDTIIHLATPASLQLSQERPKEMRDIIVAGALGVVETVRTCEVKRVLFTSSGAVDGQSMAYSAYADGKREAERIFTEELPKLGCEIKIARCYAFVGPGLPLGQHFAIGNFIREALAGEAVEIRGDGKARRSYLYAADLTTWLLRILNQSKSLDVINVGSDDAVTIADLAQEVAEEVSALVQKPPVAVQILNDPTVPSVDYIPNIEVARTKLKLDVWVKRRSAIRLAVNAAKHK